MKNNYDNVARHYDWLSRLVFYRSQVKAQTRLLPYISAGKRVLIVGGGTGWILEEITRIHPDSLDITYVEISGKMISLSKQRDTGKNQVTFLHEGIEDFKAGLPFDIVITPFLFDNFSFERASVVFAQLNALLVPGGRWLFTDFAAGQARWWQRFLLKSMYVFFRLLCDVEATTLVNMQPFFYSAAYEQLFESYYYFRFIRSAVYEKRS